MLHKNLFPQVAVHLEALEYVQGFLKEIDETDYVHALSIAVRAYGMTKVGTTVDKSFSVSLQISEIFEIRWCQSSQIISLLSAGSDVHVLHIHIVSLIERLAAQSIKVYRE